MAESGESSALAAMEVTDRPEEKGVEMALTPPDGDIAKEPATRQPEDSDKVRAEDRDSPQEKAQKLDTELEGDGDESGPAPADEHPSKEIEKEKTKDSTDSPSRSSLGSGTDSNIYHVKWVGWKSSRTPIVTQNENGPCPLLSIVNVLLLRGKLRLPEGCDVISAERLLEYLGDVIIESVPREISDARRLDYEQNVHDAIAILPKLQTGLDVNVRFTGVVDFEYTPECIIFDLLNISLYHGWLMDPQQPEVSEAVGNLTYNQLVERIISDRSSHDSVKVGQSLVAQQFLEESASQLTYHGLTELIANIKDGELAVFFRNNHFSAIYKEKTELFLLVTDQGFLKEPRVVWETLSNIDGDCHFVDEKFLTVPPATDADAAAASRGSGVYCDSPNLTSEQQIDQDHQLAMTLAAGEESERLSWRGGELWDESAQGSQLTDEELAKKLQAEENAAAAQEQARASAQGRDQTPSSSRSQPQVPSSTALAVPSSGPHRSKNCTIL